VSKKEMKFRNVSRKGKTFDGYKEDSDGPFSLDNVLKFAEATGQSAADAYKYLRKFFGSNDMRKGGMVVSTVDNRKRK
jgi:poly(3-hydroxyalkanoate) synthetase|tara:strand:- start:312 stop:545 length:234 start_codon:yes stop_codon:yes gene_type:complete